MTVRTAVVGLRDAQVVFFGELHDRTDHHDAQLMAVQALRETGARVALGLEMFEAGDQPVLDGWLLGRVSDDDLIKAYHRTWQVPYQEYEKILLYARAHGIPLVGLNAPAAVVARVAREGFAALPAEESGKVPGVSCRIDPAYEELIRRAMGKHSGGERSFRHFCEAQMVRDTGMAWQIMQFMRRNPDRTMIVIAGGGHSWKYGIPEQLRRQSDLRYAVILPEIKNRITRDTVTTAEADYLWLGL